MATLSSPGSGPCLPQGIPEVYLFGCQVSSQEIGGIFRKQWAEDRPGQLGATTAIDDLSHTQTTQRGEKLQETVKMSNQGHTEERELKTKLILGSAQSPQETST